LYSPFKISNTKFKKILFEQKPGFFYIQSHFEEEKIAKRKQKLYKKTESIFQNLQSKTLESSQILNDRSNPTQINQLNLKFNPKSNPYIYLFSLIPISSKSVGDTSVPPFQSRAISVPAVSVLPFQSPHMGTFRSPLIFIVELHAGLVQKCCGIDFGVRMLATNCFLS